ncbi:hypothetical protein BGZ79_005940, partial [Entomortierella chlamydospora]
FNTRVLKSSVYRKASARHRPTLSMIHDPTEGNNAYLKEARNVLSSKEEVRSIFGSDGSDVNILAIDLGETFTVAASAYMVDRPNEYHDLTVKRKALYQPTLRFRAWSEREKNKELEPHIDGPNGEQSLSTVSMIESSLPPRRGTQKNPEGAVVIREQYQDTLGTFYN